MVDFVVSRSSISGYGVFSTKEIKKGEIVFRYRGRVVLRTEMPPNTMYIFHNRWKNVYVDAADDQGNYLRRLGPDKQGRVMYEYVNIDPDNIEHPTIAKYANHLPGNLTNSIASAGGVVRAKRRIRKGEEITFSYGRGIHLPGKTQGKPLDL